MEVSHELISNSCLNIEYSHVVHNENNRSYFLQPSFLTLPVTHISMKYLDPLYSLMFLHILVCVFVSYCLFAKSVFFWLSTFSFLAVSVSLPGLTLVIQAYCKPVNLFYQRGYYWSNHMISILFISLDLYFTNGL